MIRNTILALTAATLVSSAALPAFATPFGEGDSDARALRAQTILAGLQEKGVNATSVEEWGTVVRAFVQQPDGTTVMQYYTPDTLQQVNL